MAEGVKKGLGMTKTLMSARICVSRPPDPMNATGWSLDATTLAGQREAAPEVRSLPALTQLIHPVDAVTFQQEYWGRRPLLVHRGDPSYYADMLTLDDVDRALSLTNVDLEGFRVVVNGADVQASQLAAPGRNDAVNVKVMDRVFEHYKDGSTIVLNRLEQRWEPLQRLSRELGSEMSARVQMNVYITPAVSQGFKAHYDTHDVFVVQMHGTKRWRICKPSYDLPLKSQPYDESLPEPEPDQEFDLNCGDLLYMPRGTIHWATSNNTTSVHVTIGVHPACTRRSFPTL